jgi:hypothetical protein
MEIFAIKFGTIYSGDLGLGTRHVEKGNGTAKPKPSVAPHVNSTFSLSLPQLRYSRKPSAYTHANMLTRLAFNLPRNAIPSVRRAVSFQVPASPRAPCRALTVSAARAQSILHGSREAKEAGEHEMQQHSRLIGRGKYLHGIESASFVPKVLQLGALIRVFP